MGMPAPGDLISDRYRLIAALGEGGMGMVWRAHHVELDVEVAIKLMSAESADDPLGQRRFRREARAAAKLKSPHIVQVLDYGIFDGHPYLAMELLEGEDLSDRLEEGPLGAEEAVDVVEGVARALELAHEAGIIHRDLKPANIFLARIGEEEVAKVLDFGVAKVATEDGQATATTGAGLVGSPAYMSPEQVWGEPMDHRTDLWSLGVVAYELLTGANPFADSTLAKVFDRIIREEPPSVREQRPDLGEAVDAFFARALARDPDERFSSARELADAFRAALLEEAALARTQPVTSGITAPAPRSAAPPAPPADRRRWLMGMIGAGLLGAVAVYASQRPSDETSAAAQPSASAAEPPKPTAAATAPETATAATSSTPSTSSATGPATTAITPPATVAPPVSPPPTASASSSGKANDYDPFTGIPRRP